MTQQSTTEQLQAVPVDMIFFLIILPTYSVLNRAAAV